MVNRFVDKKGVTENSSLSDNPDQINFPRLQNCVEPVWNCNFVLITNSASKKKDANQKKGKN